MNAIAIIDAKTLEVTIGFSVPQFDTWLAQGRDLYAKRKDLDWQCADWLATGLQNFPEQMKLALPEFATDAIEQKRLFHSAKIAAAIPASQRDTALTFAHHEHVADFPIEERLALLKSARDQNWSARRLRIEAMGERTRLGIGNMLIDDPDWEHQQHVDICRRYARAAQSVRLEFIQMALAAASVTKDNEKQFKRWLEDGQEFFDEMSLGIVEE